MPISHLLLALAVVFVWGTNFVVIKVGLREFPPLLFAALRFTLSALPWLLIIKRPRVEWRYLVGFGLLLGVGQFGLLFLAMRSDISPGLASLLMQFQVFFTLGLALLLFGEKLKAFHFAGLALAACGVGVIALHIDATTSAKGLAMTLLAALCWAGANLVVKRAAKIHGPFDMLGFMVWSSMFAAPPLFVLALLFEGGAAVRAALAHADLTGWLAALSQALGNTLFGYGAWNWLLARHPSATIVPMSLLVPVFGFSASSLVLGEPLQGWKLLAGALVLGGLAVNIAGSMRRQNAR
jgi:O-acetylserine/cysteine efflux transporter